MNQSVQISLYHDLKLQEFVQLLTVCQMPTCLFALCLSVPELVAEFVVVGSDTSCVADKSSVCIVFGPVFPLHWVNSPLLIDIKAGTYVLGSF